MPRIASNAVFIVCALAHAAASAGGTTMHYYQLAPGLQHMAESPPHREGRRVAWRRAPPFGQESDSQCCRGQNSGIQEVAALLEHMR